MPLTRLDCYYLTKDEPSNGGASAFVVLNPVHRPGTIVAAGSTAHRENIGSQVACKLAIEHFVEAVLERFSPAVDPGQQPPSELSVEVLEAAFRRANSSVYSFGHKLAAGGRMAASLTAMVISDRSVAAGRAGDGAAFLYRKGELFPFFESKRAALTPDTEHEQLVGAHSLVSVELASVPVEAGDQILLLAQPPNEQQERRLPIVLRGTEADDPDPVQTVVRRTFDGGDRPKFALMVRVGPEAIYLDKRVETVAG